MLEEAGARPPEFFAAEIREHAPAFGLSFESPAAAALARYLAELDRWRRLTNLTGPLASEALVTHALESALGERLIAHGARVLDIGSGAGLPGIPLAISRTDISVTLLEPRRKRSAFLRHVLRAADVANADVLEDRVERLAKPDYDVATVRAVGGLAEKIGTARFLREGGSLLAWTTDSRGLSDSAGSAFRLEKTLPVPGARSRCVVLLEKR